MNNLDEPTKQLVKNFFNMAIQYAVDIIEEAREEGENDLRQIRDRIKLGAEATYQEIEKLEV